MSKLGMDDLDSWTEEELEDDNRRMAADDRCYDGLWLAAGHNGMMASITEFDFERKQMEDYLDEVKDGITGGTINDHFVKLGGVPLEEIGAVLQERELSVASGVLRRMAEGICPTRIRITRLSNQGTDIEEVRSLKQRGNQAFASKKYHDAIEMYDEALFLFPFEMYISPIEEMEEIVTILSNKAECELRLERLDDCCNTATDALLFDGDHEKTRIRRAKAELAKFSNGSSLAHLVQAMNDLKVILEYPAVTTAGANAARKLNKEAAVLLEQERVKYMKEEPGGDFEFKVHFLRSTCW